jgi:hypothetical protein
MEDNTAERLRDRESDHQRQKLAKQQGYGINFFFICRVVVFLVLSAFSAGCSDVEFVRSYPVPDGAVTQGEYTWSVLRVGTGRRAMDASYWGVRSRMISHRLKGCDYPCGTLVVHRRFSPNLDPWNPLLRGMRQGEVRRVWWTPPGESERRVYEIELAVAAREDANGDPLNDSN